MLLLLLLVVIAAAAPLCVVGCVSVCVCLLYSDVCVSVCVYPCVTQYLFNGDFVDRGANGVEICITLFLFALLYPTGVILNRGNHEERSQNETGVRPIAFVRRADVVCLYL